MRLSSNAPLYIRGVSNARPTGGLVDLAMVDDLPKWHKRERERKAAIKAAATTVRKERKTRISKAKIRENNDMLLIQAQLVYDLAPDGADKRAALVKLIKAQERCGIVRDSSMNVTTIDISQGANGWLDDNRG
jgi:hypothetical protein